MLNFFAISSSMTAFHLSLPGGAACFQSRPAWPKRSLSSL